MTSMHGKTARILQISLAKRDIPKLLSIINDPKNYGFGRSFCYFPREWLFASIAAKMKSVAFMKYALSAPEFNPSPNLRLAGKAA